MKQVRSRLTYANVMSSIAVFLVLGGATALAAQKIGKHSVGTKQLKANAVTTAKIKRNAVTTRKIKKNAVTAAKIRAGAIFTDKLAKAAVTGEKIANETITGTNINAASTPFSQVVARIRTNATTSYEAPEPFYPIGSYTQPAGEDDEYLAGIEVNFPASCTPPRSAEGILLLNAPNLAGLTPEHFIGLGQVEDKGSGSVTRRIEFAPFPGLGPMSRLAPSVATGRSFAVLLAGEECNTGGGVAATAGLVDVIGTK